MLRQILLLLGLIALSTSSVRGSNLHDIATTAVLSPAGFVFPVNAPIAPSIRFTNKGTSNESGVVVALSFRDYYGVLVYTVPGPKRRPYAFPITAR